MTQFKWCRFCAGNTPWVRVLKYQTKAGRKVYTSRCKYGPHAAVRPGRRKNTAAPYWAWSKDD